MAETQVRTVYTLSAFDSSAAMAGALCVMYKKNVITLSDENPPTVSNINVTNGEGAPNDNFIGAGICTFREPNKFYFLYDSVYYIFNEKGIGVSANSIDYQLYSAKLGDVSKAEVQTVGRFIKVGVKVSNTISELSEPIIVDDSQLAPGNNTFDPNDTPVVDPGDTTIDEETSGGGEDNSQGGDSETGVTGGGNNNQQTDEENQQTPIIDPDARPVDPLIPINNTRKIEETTINYASSFTSDANVSTIEVDSLNARDQFATQVLNGMLAKLPNPAGLSDNEMNYYCNASYQWAANMMAAAARTRTSVSVADGASISNTESIGSLDNNTEKLLNNLVVVTTGLKNAQESTRETITTGTSTTYSERVTLKDVTMSDLQKLLEQKSGKTITTEGGVTTTTYTGKSPHDVAVESKMDGYQTKLVELKNILDAYVAHTATSQSDTKTKVGLDDLINAISAASAAITQAIGSSGSGSGSGSSSTIDYDDLEDAITGALSNSQVPGYNTGKPFVVSLEYTNGLGASGNPLYVSGIGVFPSRASLTALSNNDGINSFLTFDSNGAARYSDAANVRAALMLWLQDYVAESTFKNMLDTRIKAWLTNSGTKVTVNGTDYSITVPNSI